MPGIRKHNRPWSPTDVSRMRELAKKKLPATAAAPKLGRTVGSVKYKAMIEGIRFRAINQPPGTQRTRKQRATLSRIASLRHAQNRAQA